MGGSEKRGMRPGGRGWLQLIRSYYYSGLCNLMQTVLGNITVYCNYLSSNLKLLHKKRFVFNSLIFLRRLMNRLRLFYIHRHWFVTGRIDVYFFL